MSNPQIFPKIDGKVRLVAPCYQGMPKPAYVGARTSGDIVDSTGRPIVGAAMVLPDHVGVDLQAAAEAAVKETTHMRMSRAHTAADNVLRRR